MSGKVLVVLGLAAAVALVALAGVERAGSRRPSTELSQSLTPNGEPAFPSVYESDSVDPSASPALTR